MTDLIFANKVTEVFRILDFDKDGYLSKEDLHKGFDYLRIPLSLRSELLREMHFRGKGVSPNDFKEYAVHQYIKLKTLFDKLDFQKDKKITYEEFSKGVKEVDPTYDEAAIKKIFLKIDLNNDSAITFDEWCEFLILIPHPTIKAVLNYWKTIINVCDPHEFTLYGLMKTPLPPQTRKHSDFITWFTTFGVGLLAGVVSRTAMAPLDRLKLNYQVHYRGDQQPPSIFRGLQEMYRNDGLKGLFRGNLVTIIRAGPETSIKLTLFEKLKTIVLKDTDVKPSKGELFLAGAISGLIASSITFPLVVIRTRLAAAPSGTYSGIFDVVKKMQQTEGIVQPFYRGLQPSLLAVIPGSGLNLSSYETLKRIFMNKRKTKPPGPLTFMTIAGISALFSSTLLYPLQIVTTRLMMQGLLEQDKKGMSAVVKDIYKTEGIRGFYKGYRAAITKIVIGNSISFGCFEFLKRNFGINFKK